MPGSGEGQTPRQGWRKQEHKDGVRASSELGHREVTANALIRPSQVELERVIVCDMNGDTRGPLSCCVSGTVCFVLVCLLPSRVCECVCGRIRATAGIWWSEGSSQELVLCFCLMGACESNSDQHICGPTSCFRKQALLALTFLPRQSWLLLTFASRDGEW